MISGITKAGEAYVNVTCEDQQLKDGLAEVSESIRDFAKKNSTVNLSFLNAAALKAGSMAIKSAVDMAVFSMRDYGVGVADMGRNTGLMSETVSSLSYMAQTVGVDLKSVEAAVGNLNAALKNVSSSSGVAAALKEIGLSFAEFKSFDPDKQFKTLLVSLAGLEDTSKRAALGVALFGDEWNRIAPLMAGGEDGIRRAAEEAKKMGLVITEAQAKQAKEVEASAARQKSAWQGLQVTLGSNYTPLAESASRASTGLLQKLTAMAQESPGAAKAIGLVAGGLTGATAAANALKYATTVLVPAIGALGAACTFLVANPIVLGLGAIAAAVGYIGYKAIASTDHVAELSNEVNGLLDQQARQLAADQAQMERLQELVTIQNRSNEELAEAATIAQSLENTYGELGINVDLFTGKITMAADAQDKLNGKMKEARLLQLEQAKNEVKMNLAELDREYTDLTNVTGGEAAALWYWHPTKALDELSQMKADKNYNLVQLNLDKTNLQRKKFAEINEEYESLKNGTESDPAAKAKKNGAGGVTGSGIVDVSAPRKYLDDYANEQKPASVREIESILKKNDEAKRSVENEEIAERSKPDDVRDPVRVKELVKMGGEIDAVLQRRLVGAINGVTARGGQPIETALPELAAATAAAKKNYLSEIAAITQSNPNLDSESPEAARIQELEAKIHEIDAASAARQEAILAEAAVRDAKNQPAAVQEKKISADLLEYDDTQRAADNAAIVTAQQDLNKAVTALYQARYAGNETPDLYDNVRRAESAVERAQATRAENNTIALGKTLETASKAFTEARAADSAGRTTETHTALLEAAKNLEQIQGKYSASIYELQRYNQATPEYNEDLGRSLYDSLGEIQSQSSGTFSAFDTERLENTAWSKIEDNTRESANWLRELYYKKDENQALYSE